MQNHTITCQKPHHWSLAVVEFYAKTKALADISFHKEKQVEHAREGP